MLSGVQEELEKVSSERNTLQKELSNLEDKYKVMETLRDSQETELQALKVWMYEGHKVTPPDLGPVNKHTFNFSLCSR